ncbi:MAG: FtsX-like permease family protein, partial [Gammaproteobacteria bacterium]
ALVGGGFFVHSLRNAEQINPGFEVKHDIAVFLDPSSAHYAQPQAEALYRDVVQRLDAVPMVASASISDAPALGGSFEWTTFTDGVDLTDPRNGRLTPVMATAPGYFSTRGMTLLEGRDFTDADDATSAMVAIVNRTAADTFWPGQDPIGKHLHFITTTWTVTVVGEVNTVKYATLGEPPQAVIYWPLKQHYSESVFLFVRAKGDPTKVIPTMRSVMHSLAPGVPLLGVQTIEQTLDQSLTAPRMGAELLGTFGLLALVLAAIGTYGVMSYSVNQRTSDIGIRMALGAGRGDVLRLVAREGLRLTCTGLAAGMLAALALTRALTSLLYEVHSFDPLVLGGMAALLGAVSLAACWIPALRALRVDPIVALRHE